MLKKPNYTLTRVYYFDLNHYEEKSCMKDNNKRVGLLSTLLLYLFVL